MAEHAKHWFSAQLVAADSVCASTQRLVSVFIVGKPGIFVRNVSVLNHVLVHWVVEQLQALLCHQRPWALDCDCLGFDRLPPVYLQPKRVAFECVPKLVRGSLLLQVARAAKSHF